MCPSCSPLDMEPSSGAKLCCLSARAASPEPSGSRRYMLLKGSCTLPSNIIGYHIGGPSF